MAESRFKFFENSRHIKYKLKSISFISLSVHQMKSQIFFYEKGDLFRLVLKYMIQGDLLEKL